MSDIIRMNLLAQRGGAGLDASALVTDPLPDTIFQSSFWNAKGLNPNFPLRPRCIDITQWRSNFLVGQLNFLFFNFIASALDEYFTGYDYFLDYLLINHFAKIARERIPAIQEAEAKLPMNNTECEMLTDALDKDCSRRKVNLEQNFNNDTYIYKLSIIGAFAARSETNPRSPNSRYPELVRLDNFFICLSGISLMNMLA